MIVTAHGAESPALPASPRLRRARRAALLVAAMAVAACTRSTGGGGNPEPAPALGTYVFEVEHVNFAWGARRQGIHADADGTVWRYQDTPRLEDDRGSSIPAAVLAAKYAAGRARVRDVGAEEVARRASSIRAAEGPLGEEQHVCADFGTLSYRAFVYEPATDSYRPVLLHQAGDVGRAARTPAAVELTAWLRTLDERVAGGSCEPRP